MALLSIILMTRIRRDRCGVLRSHALSSYFHRHAGTAARAQPRHVPIRSYIVRTQPQRHRRLCRKSIEVVDSVESDPSVTAAVELRDSCLVLLSLLCRVQRSARICIYISSACAAVVSSPPQVAIFDFISRQSSMPAVSSIL